MWSIRDDEAHAGIVSLACYHIESEGFRFGSAECSLRRNVHAVLLHKETGIPLYFSGGKAPGGKKARQNLIVALRLAWECLQRRLR